MHYGCECGGSKAFSEDQCIERASKLSADLGAFVALINNELSFLLVPATSTPPPALEQEAAESNRAVAERSKLMVFDSRWALHEIKCLGRTDLDCTDEAKTIDNDPVASEAQVCVAYRFTSSTYRASGCPVM